jgi:hypothetical protein
VTRPWRARVRLTVAGETFTWWCCCRCQAMACGPASSPCPASSLRSRTISAAVSGLTAVGEVFGRREPRLERRLALGPVAVQQLINPGAGDPVGPGDLADRALLHSDGGNDQPGLRHPGSVQPPR